MKRIIAMYFCGAVRVKREINKSGADMNKEEGGIGECDYVNL